MAMQSKSMKDLWQDSYLASGNEDYLESLYENYLEKPEDLAEDWRNYFDRLKEQSHQTLPDTSHAAIREQFLKLARQTSRGALASGSEAYLSEQPQERVIELIAAYRRLGHLQANIDPLGLYKGVYSSTLELGFYGFTNQDLQKIFQVGSFTGLKKSQATLGELHQALRKTYCSTIGFEYMHINRADEVEWIRNRIEQGWMNFKPNKDEKLRILDRLVVADGLEKYLGFKYVGQKRFSVTPR